MLTANIIWATIRNLNELVIPYTAEEMLEFSYGASFWLCLVTGILCVIMGVLIFLMDKLWPSQVATFFGVDVLQDSEFIAVEGQLSVVRPTKCGLKVLGQKWVRLTTNGPTRGLIRAYFSTFGSVKDFAHSGSS